MPTLRPFHGIRYRESSNLKDLTCPPYDVISPDEQSRLHERSDFNAIRLELARPGGDTKYDHVAQTFQSWINDGVLVRDESSLYVYRQDFVDQRGARRRVAGVIGALELEEFGTSSGVLPHEKTMPGPKQDRLELLRALQMNVSPIYAIYRGKGEVAPFFDSLETRTADARFTDDTGILHRLWVVSAPAEIDLLTGAVATGPLVIADGHHRYETALEYARETETDVNGAGSIMCFCVDADAEELVVLPYNRALRSPTPTHEVRATLISDFAGHSVAEEEVQGYLDTSAMDHPFTAVLPDGFVAGGVSNEQLIARVGERHQSWLALDVVALHEALIPETFADVTELTFSKDPEEIKRLVAGEWDAGFLLRAMDAAQVVDVASSGERMPQKASYFWPKAITGLVFRTLR
ncbi:MAG: DUF1015 domain-containing protein [Actinobacteria bacterium]|nr:DUF1015 domain-containing protein [Actinomycetota bacterium]